MGERSAGRTAAGRCKRWDAWKTSFLPTAYKISISSQKFLPSLRFMVSKISATTDKEFLPENLSVFHPSSLRSSGTK